MKFYLGMIFLITGTLSTHASQPQIRVLIAKSQKSVKLSGMDIERTIWPKNSRKEYSGGKTLVFNCESKNYLKSSKKPIRLASVVSKTGMIKWKEDRFRGSMHVQTSEAFNGCDIISESSLEDYISTLLGKEMNAKWPIEALKAQAVAARSYAYFKIKTKQVSKVKGFNAFYDLENSEKHQVSGSFFDVTKSTLLASNSTKGQILFQTDGSLSPIFFHSKCGGKTLTPEQVWRNPVKGYVSVECPFCHNHGMKNWNNKLTSQDWSKAIQKSLIKYNKVKNAKGPYKVLRDHLGSSQVKLYAGDDFHVLKKSRLRGVLGRKTLPSNYFVVSKTAGKFNLKGSGYGHGVGLCQFGAKELALRGYTYKQILSHYFPKMILKTHY
jgi:stage II sporulation protein D